MSSPNIVPSSPEPSQATVLEDTRELSIFVTVGTDLPFDRLVQAIDEWAAVNQVHKVFAQIGKTTWKPTFIAFEQFLEPPIFKEKFLSADLIISHAGMGTILTSLQFQKPLLVMPRIASKGEHRNEHQLATAKYLKELNKINVASDEQDLISQLSDLSDLKTREAIGPYANRSLTDALKQFIQG